MGKITCVVRGCHSRTGEGISMFGFPKDPVRAQLWLEACNRGDLSGKATLQKNYKLCELHFEEKFMTKDGNPKRLFALAVPTKFPGLKRHISHVSMNDSPRKIVIHSDLTLSPQPGPSSQRAERLTGCQALPLPDQQYFDMEDGAEDVDTIVPVPFLSPSISTQTPKKLTFSTPRKQKLRLKIKSLKEKHKKVNRPRAVKSEYCPKKFRDMCDHFLNKPLAELVKLQMVLKNRKPLGRRYSDEFKKLALTLYFLGPRAYSFLGKIIHLPTQRTLQQMTKGLVSQPGLRNEEVFEAIKIKAKTMLPQDKHCSLIIDEMSLKSFLYFDIGTDEIIGLCDTGTDKKENLVAKHALVMMVRGLYTNWKLPISYFFVESEFGADTLLPMIKNCIKKLFECGLTVDCLISDLGSNFMKLSKLLGVTTKNPEFEVDKKKIIYIFDPCHLIKAFRNNLITNVFSFDNMKTSWTFVKSFYEHDIKQFFRCAPKLTNSHINPTSFEKMRVKLATQILSNTVSSSMNTYVSLGILPQSAMGTIVFIEKFDKLFDMLNSVDLKHSNPYKTVFEGTDFQLNFLDEMIEFLTNLKIFNIEDEDVTARSRSKNCCVITINGLKILWSRLSSDNFKYLRCRRINQDCLESFFGSIRQQGGNSINPTPIQFQRAFKKLFCQSYLHSSNMNCINDMDELLLNLASVRSKKKQIQLEQPKDNILMKAISLPDTDYRQQPAIIQNSFNYVCGYLIKKCINVHSCNTCIQYSREVTDLNIGYLLTYFKAYSTVNSTFGGLRAPSEKFVEYVYKLEIIFTSSFENIATEKHISHSLLKEMQKVNFKHPCDLFPLEYVIKLFIRLKIFYTLKYSNNSLKIKDKSKKKQHRKIIILSHL